jgi:hypothetical protein
MTREPMNIAAARQAAQAFLNSLPQPAGFSYVLLDDDVVIRDRCFVFFYESSRHLESNRFEDRLVGNGPIFVSRMNGEVRQLGTAKPVETYIAEFESS